MNGQERQNRGNHSARVLISPWKLRYEESSSTLAEISTHAKAEGAAVLEYRDHRTGRGFRRVIRDGSGIVTCNHSSQSKNSVKEGDEFPLNGMVIPFRFHPSPQIFSWNASFLVGQVNKGK